MLNVQVKETYAAILQPLEENVNEALRRYALEKVQARLLELEQQAQQWEEKYGCSYDLFAYRTATDETFVTNLDANSETQQWEGDLLAWEFDAEELRTWRHHLQTLLTESTPEMDCAAFIAWLQANLPLPPPPAVETQP